MSRNGASSPTQDFCNELVREALTTNGQVTPDFLRGWTARHPDEMKHLKEYGIPLTEDEQKKLTQERIAEVYGAIDDGLAEAAKIKSAMVAVSHEELKESFYKPMLKRAFIDGDDDALQYVRKHAAEMRKLIAKGNIIGADVLSAEERRQVPQGHIDAVERAIEKGLAEAAKRPSGMPVPGANSQNIP